MLIQILKSKLKQVIVTDANVEYEGSITLDKILMDTAGIRPYEYVHINSVDGKHRIESYAIPAPAGSGRVEMNGGAANFFKPGDRVHVNCWAFVDDKEAYEVSFPVVVYTDENNRIKNVG